MKLIAFDSGIERTGWAVLEKIDNNEAKLIAYGCILTTNKDRLETRLLNISNQTQELLSMYNPNIAVLEKLFFNTNTTTALIVAQAQGVVMVTLAKEGIMTEFVTPLFVKQTIAGYGRADKRQISQMVKLLLKLETMPKLDDTVDAIAVGLSFSRLLKI